MKKSIKKIINYLSQYIGKEIIRTQPTAWPVRDWSYTDAPSILVGFTSEGCIQIRHTGWEAEIFGDKIYTLPISFTDRNWITYKKALQAKHNVLNQWKGHKIRRIRPAGDHSYMDSLNPPILVSASRYHMVIQDYKGHKALLRADYTRPEDWVLA